MKRSEITSWLHSPDLEAEQDLMQKNPTIIITDGVNEWEVLSVYAGEKKNTIYIDIGVKE